MNDHNNAITLHIIKPTIVQYIYICCCNTLRIDKGSQGGARYSGI